jgi:hypothetical protein
METVFRNQFLSRNISLRGNVFAHSFSRDAPYVKIPFGVCDNSEAWSLIR